MTIRFTIIALLVSLIFQSCGSSEEKVGKQSDTPNKVTVTPVDTLGNPIEKTKDDPKVEEHAIAYCECVETYFSGNMIASELNKQDLDRIKLDFGICIEHVKNQMKSNGLKKRDVQRVAEQHCFSAIEKLNIFKTMHKRD